jgi:replicative DNA helicase
MMLIEHQLLSKVIDENGFYEIKKYNIDKDDFEALPHVYEFIRDYVREYGETPSYQTVVGKFADFEYQPEVKDSFKYLCKTLKDATAKRKMFQVLNQEANERFNQSSGLEFAKWLHDETKQILEVSKAFSSEGTNIAINGKERKEWYKENKEKRTYTYIPTPYPTLTKWLGGGVELGDMLLFMAFTNRGKSWIATHFGQTAWRHGFGVAHYSPELTKKQTTYRFETIDGHFNNFDLRRGQLTNEEEYFRYLDQFNENNDVPYIVKTMEDLPNGLSVEVIEQDLQMNPNIQMVIIDGFNLMVHGKGTNLRNNMTQTSRRLRQIFGKYNVAGIVVHQTSASSEKEANKEDENGLRIVKPPKLTDFSETSAVIQDAATVLTFDQFDGVGKILIAKAREPNVDKVLELNCNFNLGYITEASPCDYF